MSYFKHGQTVYYVASTNEIRECIFSEYWVLDGAYVQDVKYSKGQYQVDCRDLYISRKKALSSMVDEIQKTIDNGDNFVNTWSTQKEELLLKIKKIKKENR